MASRSFPGKGTSTMRRPGSSTGTRERFWRRFHHSAARDFRVTFLIGPDGRIKKIWPKVKPEEHAEEVLAAR